MLQTVKLENYYKNDSVLSWNQQIIMHLQNTTSWNILRAGCMNDTWKLSNT